MRNRICQRFSALGAYKADLYKITTSVVENQQEESVFLFSHFIYSPPPCYQMAELKIKT